jgi:hypothetical protein
MAERPAAGPVGKVTAQDEVHGAHRPGGAEKPRRIEVRPEDVLQPDRRPWRQLSLDGVVARLILLSAVVVASLIAAAAGLGRLLGLW